MDMLNDIKNDKIHKPEIEQVVREQKEFTLLGTYSLTRGLKLFAYNSLKDEIRIVNIEQGEIIQCVLTTDGWYWFDPENYNTTIDSKEIYFECLNMDKAEKRLAKFKQGKIKELMNLKKPRNSTISFW